MSALSQLYLPGAIAVWCALAFALAALWGYVDLARGDESARGFARRAYAFFTLAVLASAFVLLVALARRDFRIDYVFQYSGLDLPWHYQLAAFWAGQKGSFLIWLFWGALIGVPLTRSIGRHEGPVMGIYVLAQLGHLRGREGPGARHRGAQHGRRAGSGRRGRRPRLRCDARAAGYRLRRHLSRRGRGRRHAGPHARGTGGRPAAGFPRGLPGNGAREDD